MGAIESAVQASVLKAFDLNNLHPELDFPQRLSSSLSELREQLRRSPVDWWIHIEVRGLAREGLPRTVGKIEFYLLDKTKSTEFQQDFARVIESSRNPDSEKQGHREFVSNVLNQKMLDKTYACIPVRAGDSDAAQALALRELRQTLDIVNLFGGIVSGSESRVYLPWEANPHQSFSIVIKTERHGEASLIQRWQGPVIPFSFAK